MSTWKCGHKLKVKIECQPDLYLIWIQVYDTITKDENEVIWENTDGKWHILSIRDDEDVASIVDDYLVSINVNPKYSVTDLELVN